MAEILRSADIEGRRVYRMRRPSSHARKAKAKDAEDVEGQSEEETLEFSKVGRVRACVFHPTRRQCLGVLIRRPDALWMFRRGDLFAPLDAIEVVDKAVVVESGSARDARPKAVVGADECRLADCVIWTGLDVVTQSGERLGYVGAVTFDGQTGAVESITVDEGGANAALLGSNVISADLISGFKRGVGSDLVDDEGKAESGAIVVADDASAVEKQGGLADAAGKATAVAVHKISETAAKVKPVVSEKVTTFKARYIDVDESDEDGPAETAEPEEDEPEDALERGAKAVGRQLKRATGMFGDFLEEYRKARDE